MKLSDLRRLAIRRSVRIRFPLPNGMDCVLNEHGIAQVRGLHALPDFNLEEEFARAGEFTLETVVSGEEQRAKGPQLLTREQLAAMAGADQSSGAGHDEHED
jgi:hypothetical protein